MNTTGTAGGTITLTEQNAGRPGKFEKLQLMPEMTQYIEGHKVDDQKGFGKKQWDKLRDQYELLHPDPREQYYQKPGREAYEKAFIDQSM